MNETEYEEGDAQVEPEVDQPGLAPLREAAAERRRMRLPRRALRQDVVAGLSLTAANVPDGMANALLVGVNPLYGLYATMIGPSVGGLFSSTRLMVISTTAAASLTTGQALGARDRAAADKARQFRHPHRNRRAVAARGSRRHGRRTHRARRG